MPTEVSNHSSPVQLTLVALYAAKPANVTELIHQCQSIATDALGHSFHAYAMDQVHATIAGMERVTDLGTTSLLNRNARELFEHDSEMHFDQLSDIVSRHLPISIRWGGYLPGDVGYNGACQSPFERSIYFNRTTGRLVLIGWPHINGDFSIPRLLHFRNDLEEGCALVHKYRQDNDFFQVLGTFDVEGIDPEELASVERTLADLLADTRENFELTANDCRIVRYRDTTLPPNSTESFPIAETEVTHEFVASLFDADSNATG